MCGIAGIVHRDADRPVPLPILRRLCDALRHRGPDDAGYHVAGPVGLGMRRLSIIDVAGGRQPMTNEDGTLTIVFNGEIYNYREVRAGLLARGHTVRTASDTETIVHLYEERGARCVEALRGMFAFALWDQSSRRLLLARDRFGIKPLYVVCAPWGIAFASELKALVAAGLTTRALDREALAIYLETGYIPAPLTPFTDVRKLEPGCTLSWSPDREPIVERYWDLPLEPRPEPPDLEARLLHWLDDAVAAHMVSDVPVAAFLSGGLDSSAVVTSMAALGASPHVFTARYHGSGADATDETPLARALADHCGARLTVIDVAPGAAHVLEPIIAALDEPHADDSVLPTWLLSQAVGAQYKVALTGIGGDELFAGYRRHRGLLAGEHYGRLPSALRRSLAAGIRLLPDFGDGLGLDRLKRFVSADARHPAERYVEYVSRLRDGDRLRLSENGTAVPRRGGARAHFRRLAERAPGLRGLRAALYLEYKAYLPDDVLALSDRLSMAHSLEIRVPLVDHVLVESVFGLPDGIKLGLWHNKRLLRRAVRSRLPAAHLHAPKRGFVGPTSAWLRHELRPLLLDELSPDRLTRVGLFEPHEVRRLLDDHLSRRHNREALLWALLSFGIWHRVYRETAGTPAYSPS